MWISLIAAAHAYELFGSDWTYQSDPIEEEFVLQTSGFSSSAGTSTELLEAYESAQDSWKYDGDADVEYLSGGTTTSTSWSSDTKNVGQYYASTNDSALALAQFWMSGGGDIIDCDIRFYGENDWGDI